MSKVFGTGALSSENLGNMNDLRSCLWAQSESLAITYGTIAALSIDYGSAALCFWMDDAASIWI